MVMYFIRPITGKHYNLKECNPDFTRGSWSHNSCKPSSPIVIKFIRWASFALNHYLNGVKQQQQTKRKEKKPIHELKRIYICGDWSIYTWIEINIISIKLSEKLTNKTLHGVKGLILIKALNSHMTKSFKLSSRFWNITQKTF